MDEPANQAPEKPKESKASLITAWRWPIVFMVVAIAAVWITQELSPARLVQETEAAGTRALRSSVDVWKDLTKTEVEMKITEFIEGLPTLEDDMALVVTRLDMTKSLYAENKKTKWGIDLGTTKVLLSVPSRVHYAVDLTGKKPVRFEIDGQAKVFRAYFPDPEVLAVEIFDKDKKVIVDTGWGRLRSRSGEAMMESLEDRKYSAVRSKAESAEMIDSVRERARPVLARFIALYLQQGQVFGSGTDGFDRIEVFFAGDDPAMIPLAFDESVFSVEVPQDE